MANNCVMNLKIWAGKERGRGLLLAKTLGVKPPTVSDWITGKKQVPLERCMPIETATGGEVTRRDLRPKDHHIHWPEMALGQQIPGPAAIETIAISNDTLSPVCDLPPIVSAPAVPAWDGIDRRGPVARPVPPELDRRAAPAGGGV